MWISPWMSILLVDYFLVRRQTFSIPDLYRDGTTSIYGKFNARGLVSLAAGLLAGWSWQYGVVPAMQGPVAKALGNTDFSWLSGSLVAGGIYGILSTLASARRTGA